MKRIYHSYIPILLQESAYIQLYSSFFRFCCVQSSYVPSCKLCSKVISQYGDVVIDSGFCNIVHFSNVHFFKLFIFPPKDENFELKQNINKHLVHIYFGFSAHFSFPNTDTHFGENSHIVHFILIHTFGSPDNSL